MPVPPGRPPMIRTDASNPFANHTLRVRVPATVRQTRDNAPDAPPSIRAALDALADGIAADAPIPPLGLPAPDCDDWAVDYAAHAGHTWQATDWFFAEIYAYRLIIEAVRWWETGRDPFAPIKQAEETEADLWAMLDEALATDGPPDERLHHLLHDALWGNRIDLSFAASTAHGTTVAHDDLLVDHSPRVVEHLLRAPGTVHLVADNYGRELAMDLVLIDHLLAGLGAPVVLHVKLHPTFVSDATVPDVLRFLGLMAGHTPAARGLGARLTAALETGQLHLAPDPYWNSPRPLWNLPPRLAKLFAPARLVLFKGDLNYRRLVGDAIWPEGVSLADATRGFPAPLVALRSLKSDPIVGLPPGLPARLDALDPAWRVNGKRGLFQSTL